MTLDNRVIEGAASNIFIVTDNVIKTPSKSHQMLTGITRDLILEIAAQQNIKTFEADISVDELFSANEVWLSSFTKEILLVIKIDDKPIGKGVFGLVWQDMIKHYANCKQKLVAGEIT